MNNRECINAMLHYHAFDRVPIVHMGFWDETLVKWMNEGHLKHDEVDGLLGRIYDGYDIEKPITKKLGFDDNILVLTGQKGEWYDVPLFPTFEQKVVERYKDGSCKKIDRDGVYVLGKDDACSIPMEIDHTLKDRKSWEEYYLPKLQWDDARLDTDSLSKLMEENNMRDRWMGVYCGSLYGKARNFWGIVEISYLQADDPGLFEECLDKIADISYEIVKHTLEKGIEADHGHFWEDICYRNGPLINPKLFDKSLAKHYKRISDLLLDYGVDIITLDCDGFIEELVPTWLDNGVNTMFPIEYGAWEYDFCVMRKKYGKELRGIGNVNKSVLSMDKNSVDKEIERVRRIVDLGGYVPCFDHRIAPDAKWELVQYYCDSMRTIFGG